MSTPHAPAPRAPDAASLAHDEDGLTIVRRMLDGKVPQAAIAETLDYRLVAADHGSARFEGSPQARFGNPHGSMHGGWIATLLDSATGCAVRTILPRGSIYSTLDLHVRYLRAVTAASGPMRAEARVVHSGGRTAVAEGRLLDAAGTLHAHATATCLVLPAPRRAAPDPSPHES